MLLSLAKNNFLGIENIPVKKTNVVIVPFGLEKTTTFGRGTAKGPQRIIEISPNLEYFDEELEKDIYKEVKISTIQEPKIKNNQPEAIAQLEKIISDSYDLDKFPLTVGGEHSLTLGPVRSAVEKFKKISILQLDAHADLRDNYEGTMYNHASVMRQCLKLKGVDLTQVGIRNISTDSNEFGFLRENQDRIKTFWAKDMAKWKINEIINSLDKNVYLTFDVDAFDSSLMPATGTPEPGGLQWYQTMEILRAVAENRNIVGADVVELAPIDGFSAPDFLVAKLIYKIIGYTFLT